MPVIFSDFLVSNEMSRYTENNSTTIFIVHELFLSYKLFKVYRNNMDHPVTKPTIIEIIVCFYFINFHNIKSILCIKNER